MRRAFPPPLPAEALQQFETMHLEGMGVELMLRYLPQGASMEEAHQLYKRLGQASRAPCTFLDVPLGIRRD
jgi:hypothetical protein